MTDKLTINERLREWRYWNIKRPLGKLGWKVLRWVPKRALYWAVIQAAVVTEPNLNPGETKVLEVLKRLEDS